MSEETIEGLTKEINRLGDSYYGKSDDFSRQECVLRMASLEERRDILRRQRRLENSNRRSKMSVDERFVEDIQKAMKKILI